MSRALTTAVTADFSECPAGFSKYPVMASLMFVDMSQATTWTRLSTVTNRIACRLKSVREVRNKGEAAPPRTVAAASRLPGREERADKGDALAGGFENSTRAGQSHESGMKGLAGRDPIQRPASAGPVRKAMQASGGK
jgi:hypothetical protein